MGATTCFVHCPKSHVTSSLRNAGLHLKNKVYRKTALSPKSFYRAQWFRPGDDVVETQAFLKF